MPPHDESMKHYSEIIMKVPEMKWNLQVIIEPGDFNTNICIDTASEEHDTRVQNIDRFGINKHQ